MEDYFKYNIIVMNQIGCWPLPNNRRTENLKKLLAIFHISTFLLESVSIWGAVFEDKLNILIFAEGVLEGLLMVQSSVKMAAFAFRRNYVRDILSLLVDLRLNTPIDDEKFLTATTEKWMKQAHLWVKLAVVSFAISLLIFISLPWIQYFMYDIKRIFFLSKFQKEDKELINFIIWDLCEILASYSSLVLTISGEIFFSTTALYLCSRLEVLEKAIHKSVEEAIKFKSTTKLFGICIEYHKKILRVCETLEEFYSPMLIIQFFASTISICLTTFLAMQTSSIIDKGISYKLYLVGILLELFVYCYFGQLLQTKFEQFEIYTVYLAWYDAPLSYQKDIKFFLMCCLKPVTFTAYKISPVNLESFFSICKASLSYYTMLRSFMDEE